MVGEPEFSDTVVGWRTLRTSLGDLMTLNVAQCRTFQI